MESRKEALPGPQLQRNRDIRVQGSWKREPSKLELGPTVHSPTLRAFWWETWEYRELSLVPLLP